MTNAQPYISEPKGSPNSHLRRVQNQRDELKAINAELLEALLIAQSQLQGLRDSIYDEGKRKIRAIIAKATQA